MEGKKEEEQEEYQLTAPSPAAGNEKNWKKKGEAREQTEKEENTEVDDNNGDKEVRKEKKVDGVDKEEEE